MTFQQFKEQVFIDSAGGEVIALRNKSATGLRLARIDKQVFRRLFGKPAKYNKLLRVIYNYYFNQS